MDNCAQYQFIAGRSKFECHWCIFSKKCSWEKYGVDWGEWKKYELDIIRNTVEDLMKVKYKTEP